MSELINEYLVRLKRELAEEDPATIQDAMSDAEEHLWTALEKARDENPGADESEIIASEIEEYGSAPEVAAAYREIESRTRPALVAPKPPERLGSPIERFIGVILDPAAYAALLYMFFSLILGIFYFTWTVSGLSVSAGISILIIGVPFFGFFLLSVRGLALVDGRIIEALLGERMPRREIFTRKGMTWRERLVQLVTDPITWKAVAYNLLMFPLGILYFSLTVVSLAISLSMVLRPVLEYVFHLPFAELDGVEYWTPLWMMPVSIVFGALWFFMTLHGARGIGRFQAKFAKRMLVRD